VSAPLVSVIVAARDAGSTLVDTLESVRRQTVTDLEVIVIDDGSTDDTVARVARVTDPRITLASFPGAGISTARNRGIARARGAYLSFLDADDLWTAGQARAPARGAPPSGGRRRGV
jgi:glycosyltransferase involved in cell wall biosynthesis